MKIATLGFTSLLIVCTACSKGTFDDSTPGDGTGDRDAGLDPAQGGDAAVSPSRDASMHADGGADGGGDGGLRCADLTCTTQNDCSVGSCEEKIGCVYGPAPDGTACGDTSQQTAGECVGGKCSILPQCWGSSPLQFLSCGAGSRDNSTKRPACHASRRLSRV